MAAVKTLKELADYLGGTVTGDEQCPITGLGGLDDAGAGDLTFLANPKYGPKVATTSAAAVIIPKGAERYGKNVIEVDNPYLAFAKLLTLFCVKPEPAKGVMDGAWVSPTATLGDDVTIYPGACVADGVKLGNRVTLYPGVVLYEGVEVGDNVTLHANVVIYRGCRLGNRVTVHGGTVIGSDGFGYAPDGKGYFKIPQIGIVVVEDDVEIGANCTIDRAALKATVIGKGTKLDNLVQVAHNCIVGENCIIVSQVGVAGSTKIGNHVTLAGQAGIVGHLEIGDNSMVGAQSGVAQSLPPNSMVSGSPAVNHRDWLKTSLVVHKLPEMRKTISSLEKRIADLEARLSGIN